MEWSKDLSDVGDSDRLVKYDKELPVVISSDRPSLKLASDIIDGWGEEGSESVGWDCE